MHTLNDLYNFLEFDHGIQQMWHSEMCVKENHKEPPLWYNFAPVSDAQEYQSLQGIDLSELPNTDSLLSYHKGNHDMFRRIVKNFYLNATRETTTPYGKMNWYVPFKDPIDKLIGGYFSSEYYSDNHGEDVAAVSHKDHYSEMEVIMHEIVDATLSGSLHATRGLYDIHLTPLSIVIEDALAGRPLFYIGKLVGLDLTVGDYLNKYFYNYVLNANPTLAVNIFKTTHVRRSPYTHTKSHYLQMYKRLNPQKITELMNGPLYNEYKLYNYFIHQDYYKNIFYNGQT